MGEIKIDNVTKTIGNKVILSEINVEFQEGKIYGLIGRNGAGKTMLLKCICGISPYNNGTITIDGKIIGKDIDIPESVGVIIETPGFIPQKTGYDNLKYLAELTGKADKKRIEEILQWVGLDSVSKKSVRKYSLGMRQRLGIAQAILDNPDILLLDEPMNGLDNEGVESVKEMLVELRKQRKTIILSSHHMEDIRELCDIVYTMDRGRISLYEQ